MLSITVLRSFLLYSFVCDSPNDCTHFVTVWSLLNWKLHFGQPANSKRPQQFQKINSQFILTKKPEPRKCATCSNRSIGCIYAIAKQSKARNCTVLCMVQAAQSKETMKHRIKLLFAIRFSTFLLVLSFGSVRCYVNNEAVEFLF